MKILQINSTINWGSTGRIAEEIGQKLIAEGNESYIAYGRYANQSLSKTIKIGNKWNIYNHVIQSRLFDRHGLASEKETKNLIKIIKGINPDIVHLHNIHGYYLNYPIIFEYLTISNIPVVWTLHDCWAFTGHCSYYSFQGCCRWKTKCYSCPQIKKYPQSWGMDCSEYNFKRKSSLFTSLRNMVIVPVSNWLASDVKESFMKDYPMKVIHNGIDLDVFFPSNNLNYIENDFLILGVANIWEERKGLNDFIFLRNKLPINYKMLLIGLSKTQIKSLPDGIEAIERTNNVQELTMYYSKANVFFNPTWEDNFPTTNLEALACGTPVITYRTGGSPEAIDEQTGFVVEQGDLEGVIRAVGQIKAVGKRAYIKPCRERAVNYFNKEDRYAEYLQLYKDILNRE